jgi:filamentous hemagglutinin
MNKRVHRLVFDRRRGMRVPAAEHVRSSGKAAGGQSRAVALACALSLVALADGALAQNRSLTNVVPRAVNVARSNASPLPVYSDTYSSLNRNFAGRSQISVDGNAMTVLQTEQSAIINWDSFNINRDYSVTFVQPDKGKVLNRIWDANPSVIMGRLSGNGEIMLENTNGVVFGDTARVDAGKLVVTALKIADETFMKGIRSFRLGEASFTSALDAEGNVKDNGFVSVERGAEIRSLAGGDVIMVAPKVLNDGLIQTPGGQAILAAGKTVYLYAPTAVDQRGLIVAVDGFANGSEGAGTVENLNKVIAENGGTINLVGAAIRQRGNLTATTAIKGQNGSIFLSAQKDTFTTSLSDSLVRTGKTLGTIELGEGSVISVLPVGTYIDASGQVRDKPKPAAPAALPDSANDAQKAEYTQQKASYDQAMTVWQNEHATQTAADVFYKSRIDIIGASVHIGANAQVIAPSGNISVLATEDYSSSSLALASNPFKQDTSSLVVDAGAVVSVAGVQGVQLEASRNQLSTRLFSIELADSPVQRGGVLYRNPILADARRVVSVADVTGAYNAVPRSAAELSTTGGAVTMQAQGTMLLDALATVRFGGGNVVYEAGTLQSSLLVRDGVTIRIENAQKDLIYDTLLPSTHVALINVPSFTVGANAGSAYLGAPHMMMDAALDGSVLMGDNQRLTAKVMSADTLKATPSLYAGLRPMAGSLTIGAEFAIDSNNIPQGQLIGQIRLSKQGSSLADALNADNTVVSVSLDKLDQAHLGKLQLRASSVSMPEADSSLVLASGGALDVRAGSINLNGTVVANGATASLAAYIANVGDGDVTLGSSARLQLNGTQRDERYTAFDANDGVVLQGGRLQIEAARSATLSKGSVVDVSAGVWRSTSGALSTGVGNAVDVSGNALSGVSIKANTAAKSGEDLQGKLTLQGSLLGYDFKSGAPLVLEGMRSVTIGKDNADPYGMSVPTSLFADLGFGSVSIKAFGNVDVAEKAQITPVLTTLLAQPVRRTSSVALFEQTVLQTGLRQPVKLSLTAKQEPFVGLNGVPGLEAGASVNIGMGALIDVGLGGSVKLTAGRSIELAGAIWALGGQVTLALSGPRGSNAIAADGSTDTVGYLADQQIHLAKTSSIDVSGAVKSYMPNGDRPDIDNEKERVVGDVLAAGTVTLGVSTDRGIRGRVVMEDGASIKLNGATGRLDRNPRLISKTTLSSAAGTLNINSADGFEIKGNIEAKAPDSSVAGGRVNVSLSRDGVGDADLVGDMVATGANPYGKNERVIHLLKSAQDVRDYANAGKVAYAEGVLSSDQLVEAGFTSISLRSENQVLMDLGVNLKASGSRALQSVSLDTRVIKGLSQVSDGKLLPVSNHEIVANYVALGDRDIASLASDVVNPDTLGNTGLLAGNATLTVDAGLIEVAGHSALQGFSSTRLAATLDAQGGLGRTNGEIRFIGRHSLTSYALGSKLSFSGALDLVAGQTYSTTLSQTEVTGYDTGNKLTISAPAAGAGSALPLSALGALALSAQSVKVDGALAQPFGAISITADKLELTDRANFSVTGDGLVVPVGTTVTGKQWVYATNGAVDANGAMVDLNPKNNATVRLLDALPVSKSVKLNGKTLSISSDTALSAQAGGDLLAWEFIKGPGGSTDTLNRKDVYAILPNYSYDFAPYDTEIAASTKAVGTTLRAGDQVHVSTGSSVLAAGTYTLLPARYGLLPGAVLVSATTLSTPTTLKQAMVKDDGSVVVSGYKTSVGSGIDGGHDTRLALVLEPEATFRTKSELTRTSINSYLDDLAVRTSLASVTRPGDGGLVSLQSDAGFQWAAKFNFGAAAGFAGGELDLAMPKMAVQADSSTLLDGTAKGELAGYFGLSLSALNATGASSILLGGVRSDASNSAVITQVATDVLWQAALNQPSLNVLEAPGEVLSVATKTVTVQDGLTLRSTGNDATTNRAYTIKGDGAALLVGNVQKTTLTRSGSAQSGVGDLTLGDHVVLDGASVQVDATGALGLSASASLLSDSVGLGAKRIAVGAELNDPKNVLSLSGTLLDGLNKTSRIQLRTYSSLDFYGSSTLGGDNVSLLTIDTPQLLGKGSASDEANIVGQEVVFVNSAGKGADAAKGLSALQVKATPTLTDGHTGGITFGDDAAGAGQRFAFASTSFSSTGDVIFKGTGLVATQAAANIQAARVAAAGKADHGITSASTITITTPTGDAATLLGVRTLNESLGVGGKLALKGERVVQDGWVEAQSGTISITGTGLSGQADTVQIKAGSKTVVAGRSQSVSETSTVATPGGAITVEASNGDVILDGTLDASAPSITTADGQSPAAGSVTLLALGFTTVKDPVTGTSTVKPGTVRVGSHASVMLNAGTVDQATLGGSVKVDAQNLAVEPVDTSAAAIASAASANALDQLFSAALQAKGAKLSEVEVRVRQGDQMLNAALQAQRVSLTTDAGVLTLGGKAAIDAQTAQGGVVKLNGGIGLTLQDGASINAQSTRDGANGGDVLLSAASGNVSLGAVSINAASANDDLDGRVVVRAKRDDSKVTVNVVVTTPVDTTKSLSIKAGQIDVEAVRIYDDTANADSKRTSLTTGSSVANGTSWGLTTINADSTTFLSATNKTKLLAAMGLTGKTSSALHLKSGVEIRSKGDFTIGDGVTDFNLTSTRFGGEPMVLTVRAGGNLTVKNTLSDGFASANRTTTLNKVAAPEVISAGDAASFRLVAGADTTSADVLATKAANTSALTVASGKMVRTTAGSIELAAAGDIKLQASTITNPDVAAVYVAGRLAALATGETFGTDYWWSQYTERGGRLDVKAGGNIAALQTTGAAQTLAQMPNNWFYHAGTTADSLAWWSGMEAFRQGFGSFGGGNVSVKAGKNISDVAVVAPTSARQVKLASDSSLQLRVNNGGDINVAAGGDISGGAYFLGRGEGVIKAGGKSTQGASGALAPVLALMDGHWSLSTQGDLNLSNVYNPTALASDTSKTSRTVVNASTKLTGPGTGATDLLLNEFVSYQSGSGVSLSSLLGDVTWTQNWEAFRAAHNIRTTAGEAVKYASVSAGNQIMASLAPPVVDITSFTGDVNFKAAGSDVLRLMPSKQGDLTVFAARDVNFNGTLSVLNGLEGALPTSQAPMANASLSKLDLAVKALDVVSKDTNDSPIDSAYFKGVVDALTIHAGNDIVFTNVSSTNLGMLRLARAATISAGHDIKYPYILGQNFSEGDVTTLSAGNDIVGSKSDAGLISIGGPGLLSLEAGRTIDLGLSKGVTTTGNANNLSLADQGAKIQLLSGLNKNANLAQAQSTWGDDPAFRAQLSQAVMAALQLPSALTWEQTVSAFASLKPGTQVAALDHYLNARFVAEFMPELAGRSDAYYRSNEFQRLKKEALWAKIQDFGGQAVAIAASSNADEEARRVLQRQALFKQAARAVDLAGLGDSFNFTGDIEISGSKVHTAAPGGGATVGVVDDRTGGIDLYTPGGKVLVGLTSVTDTLTRGLVTEQGGSIRSFSAGDFLVNAQKAFTVGKGNIVVYSSGGSIDSGKGSNTSVDAQDKGRVFNRKTGEVEPEPVVKLTGSGIQILADSQGQTKGKIKLYAPNGEIRALDAYIGGGDGVDIVAPKVLGADNITNAVGVAPSAPPTVSLNITPKAVDTAAGVQDVAESSESGKKSKQANSILTVELLGLGDEVTTAPASAAGSTTAGNSVATEPSNPKDKRRKDADTK